MTGSRIFKNKFLYLLIFACCISVWAEAQTNYYFYVQFKNKNNSPYSLSNPSAYLSARAISRRATFGVVCDSTDLPINPNYLTQIENLGVHVHSRSKWMNGATVILSDSTKMSQVRSLSFVKFVQYTGLLVGAVQAPKKKISSQLPLDYGVAGTQITQLNGKQLHVEGYRGKGIHVAVIDAGFTNVNVNVAFDSLRLKGRLLGTKDIINPNSNIYTEDTHGAMCLSTMAGNMPGQYLGTAPDASYWLIRTEYSPTEYKVETDFWCAGIEFADSVGVDLVTSSLGYSTFDDPSMNFTYSDMNGKVSRASRAATLASKKGLVVLVAAGNEGAGSWKYISSPSDADGIITVGAITSSGTPSSFTSYGPSSDGRVKPEICAMGTASALVSTAGTTTTGNGTSFATPIVAGMMACLLQRYKALSQNISVSTLLQSVFKTGSLFSTPTALMGYGIPNFSLAEQNLITLNTLKTDESKNFQILYSGSSHTLTVNSNENIAPNSFINIYSMSGRLMVHQPIDNESVRIKTNTFVPGVYAVNVWLNGKCETTKVRLGW